MRKISIAIVDNNTMMYAVYNNMFGRDYEISCFKDFSTVDTIKNKQPSLILLNLEGGYSEVISVINKLKSDYSTKDIPIIVIGPQGDSIYEEKCILSGAIEYVHRPISQPVMIARVNTFVQLFAYAFNDKLTGLYNRRFFDDIVAYVCNGSLREKSDISLCMIDVDCFKLYNDDMGGHSKGDEALNAVAGAIKGVLQRHTDIAARYGGEEFVVILPGVDCEGSKIVADQLNQAVRNLTIPHETTTVERCKMLTISVGVATGHAISDPNILIQEADDNLYKAKKEGRNRFVHSWIG